MAKRALLRIAQGFLVAALCGLAGAVPAVAAEDRIAAVVNDDLITRYDVDERVKLALLSAGLTPSPETHSRVLPQVLRQLIDERLQAQEAKRLGINVGDDEVAGSVAAIERQNRMAPNSLIPMLQQNGIDPASLREQTRTGIAWARAVRRLAARETHVGEQEIDARLAALKASLGQPEFLLGEIFLPVDDPASENEVRRLVEQLVGELRAGAPFAALARQFSRSPSAAQGGLVGWVGLGVLEPELEQALLALKPGDASPPVRTRSGYYIIAVSDRRIVGQSNDPNIELSLAQVFLPLPRDLPETEAQKRIAALEEVSRTARSCADIEEHAKRLQAPESGSMGMVKASDLPDGLRAILLALKVDEASRPLPASDGIAVLMVCERTDPPGAVLPSRDEIAQRIEVERMDLAARRYLRDLRRSAFIDIRL